MLEEIIYFFSLISSDGIWDIFCQILPGHPTISLRLRVYMFLTGFMGHFEKLWLGTIIFAIIMAISDYLKISSWKGIYEVPLDVDINDLYKKYKKNKTFPVMAIIKLSTSMILIYWVIYWVSRWLIHGLDMTHLIIIITIIPSILIIFGYSIFLHGRINKAILKHRMKKRIHSEEQKEKIQYINILERKLNYIEGFETEVSKIKPKLKSLNNIEEIEKDINALEIKINIRDNILNIINEVISQSKR